MLVLTIRKFELTNEYIEITHKSGDVIKICLVSAEKGKVSIGHDAKKEEFDILRKKIHVEKNYNK